MKNHLRENFDKNLYEKVPFKNVFFVLICQIQVVFSEKQAEAWSRSTFAEASHKVEASVG